MRKTILLAIMACLISFSYLAAGQKKFSGLSNGAIYSADSNEPNTPKDPNMPKDPNDPNKPKEPNKPE